MSLQWLLVRPRVVSCLALAMFLGVGGIANSQEIATLTDTSGIVMKLQAFKVSLSKTAEISYNMNSFAYFRGMSLRSPMSALPIRQTNGAILFIAFDSIKEFQSDGKNATVTLVNSDQLQGSPLSGASVEGETALGKVSVALPKVKNLKINAENAKKYMDGEEQAFSQRSPSLQKDSWPTKYKSKAEITLVTGDGISLGGLAYITEVTSSGCDEQYIPCRPWSRTNLGLREEVPVRYGESAVELEFSKARLIELTAPAKPGAGPGSLNISLRSGEQITATIRYSAEEGSEKPIAFIGTTSYGFAHIPIARVKSIKFAD